MSANATAKLTLSLHVQGQTELRSLSTALAGIGRSAAGIRSVAAALERLGAASRTVGSPAAFRGFASAVSAIGPGTVAAARGIRNVESEMARLNARAKQATHQGILLPGMQGPAAVRALRSFEDERTRLQRAAEQRANTQRAKESLGMGATGGFLAGHGFASRPRQVLGLVRDSTIAAMGATYVATTLFGAVRGLITPVREFEHAMTEVRTKGSFSVAQTAEIAARARGLGRTTQFSAREGALGAVELAAAGLKAPDISKQLGTVLRFALGGNLDTQNASTALVETSMQFQKTPESFGHIADVMIKAANMSTISVADMTESLKYLGPIASTAGVSLEDVSAMLALVGERGIKGSLAGTALRQMLVGLTTPARQAKKAMAELGLNTKDLNEGLNDVPRFLQRLDKIRKDKGMSQPQRLGITKRLFGVESLSAVEAMLQSVTTTTANGRTVWDTYRDGIDKAGGSMDRAAELFGNTLDGKIRKLNASVEDLRITFGEKLAPVLSEKVLPALGSAARAVGDFVGQNGGLVHAMAVGIPTALGATLMLSITRSLAGMALTAGGLAPTMALGTAIGTSLVATISAALVAGLGGFAIGSIIAAAIDAEGIGARIYAALNPLADKPGTGSGDAGGRTSRRVVLGGAPSGTDGLAPLPAALQEYKDQQQADMEAEAEEMGGYNSLLRKPRAARGKNAEPWGGKLKIEITQEGKPRVLSVETTGQGPVVDVGTTVSP